MSDNLSTKMALTINTVFGADALRINSWQGSESVSELFDFELVLHSQNHNLSFDEIIGTDARVNIQLQNAEETRYFNGIISSFQHDGAFVLEGAKSGEFLSQYRAKLVPWFWSLQLNNDCRIFQEKSIPTIVKEVLAEHKIAKFQFRLTKTYEKREYCVQYRESDFNFISRLLEEEGIYYYFEHSEKEHILILVDDLSQINLCSRQPNVKFESVTGDNETKTFFKDLKIKQEMKPDSVQLRDFNFKSPSFNLVSDLKSKKSKGYEVYDYPGEFDKVAQGDQLARVRYEEQQCQKELMTATTNGRGFESGFRFKLEEHPRKDFNREYTLLKVDHEASQETYRSNTGTPFQYWCNLTCIPYKTPYRPTRKTEIPKIVGTQTAIVVGPKGEEIHVDKHGRVRVHFHWDRVAKNSKSSCWMRVSQPWAGTGFGGMTIPRIGQEVIVDFLEGNPDNPIITGRVYNGEAKPPYELPANKAHSGLMSRSTPGGGSANFNGIRFNDESGGEMMEVQAEKDQQILVKNNNDKTVGNCETAQIGVDRTENVGNNETITIGNNRTESVGSNEKISIGSNRDEDVGSNETVKIGSNRNTTVGSNDVLSVGLTRTHSVGINEAISVGVAQEISIGAVQIVSVGMTQMINVGLKQKVSAGKEISLKAPNILLEATETLQIKCGAGVIQFDAAGNITIKSPMVKINC